MTVANSPSTIAIETILLATDFSASSERAADYARAIARQFSATLEMVHVAKPLAIAVADEVAVTLVNGNAIPANGKPQRGFFTEAGVKTRASTAEGDNAAQTLLQLASTLQADLIVTATRAKSGIGRLVLGSTAETLIRKADCPVITIGPKAALPAADTLFRTIVYATDFSPQAAKAAGYALSLSAVSHARLCCCFVEDEPVEVPALRAERTSRFTRELHELMPDLPPGASTPEFFIEQGDPADAILRLARQVHADLIVLGPRKSTFWLNYVDHGLTPALLAESTCPVMTIC